MATISTDFLRLIERNLRFEYREGGNTWVTPPHTTGWRVLPSLVVSQIEYTGLFEQDGRKPLSTNRGDAVIMAPGLRHRATLRGRRAGFSYWSHTQCEVLQGVSLFYLLSPRPLIRAGPRARRLGAINQELAEMKMQDASLRALLRRQALGWELVTTILEDVPFTEERIDLVRNATRLTPVLAYIEDHFAQPISHQLLARTAGLSPSRFHVLFRAALGAAPYAYVQKLRLEKAQQMLVRTDRSIAEVGEAVGHPDPYHFSRVFRRYVGVSPVAFRRQALGRSHKQRVRRPEHPPAQLLADVQVDERYVFPMPRRIVIAVGVASYPRHAAGNTWAFLQWVLGFRAAGWDVWMVEAITSSKCIDAEGQACRLEQSINLSYWKDIVAEFGLQERATLIVDGRSPEMPALIKFAHDAEIFFNISGHFHEREVLAAPRQRIYVDIDPAFTQIWSEIYHADMRLEAHDVFVTIGRHIGRPDCKVPADGRKWLPIGVPVMLDYFLPVADQPGEVWTTFTHWYGYPPVEYDGAWYGNKSEEFAKLVNLPRRTREKLEIATDLHPEDKAGHNFTAGGWSLVDARPLNTPWQNYRDYAGRSRGEFCVAKNGYVRSRCGWFSDRSAMYLALGRPVILQETGWSDFLPTGEGLLSFHDEESAAAALDTAGRDPERHGRAARAIAEKYFSAPLVVDQFLETIGAAH